VFFAVLFTCQSFSFPRNEHKKRRTDHGRRTTLLVHKNNRKNNKQTIIKAYLFFHLISCLLFLIMSDPIVIPEEPQTADASKVRSLACFTPLLLERVGGFTPSELHCISD
jgi:hypothetical protein